MAGKTKTLSEAREYIYREAQTKEHSFTRFSLEETPETENVSSLNIAKRTLRNLKQKQTKRIRGQLINHFCQHDVMIPSWQPCLLPGVCVVSAVCITPPVSLPLSPSVCVCVCVGLVSL